MSLKSLNALISGALFFFIMLFPLLSNAQLFEKRFYMGSISSGDTAFFAGGASFGLASSFTVDIYIKSLDEWRHVNLSVARAIRVYRQFPPQFVFR